ncbi:MAG TPA: ABC transporter ATP-binding protein [Verrucomicrobiales bacterium]|jgi:putative ABC transport system ATP-binding protein|nr:ABC transporter ATP-binding protein [Verrucomicrobiales bacterium]
MDTLAIKTEHVCKGFGAGEARTEVLKDIAFDAKVGEVLMLVGPSGCGKTTLLSVIAGTLSVDRGEVEVFNEPLHKLDKSAVTRFRAANIGFIFQQYNLIPTLNCTENVSVPLRIQGCKSALAERKAAEMLEKVGLGNRTRHRPNMLSGGQQQRVAIARALVHEPRLIICDEPTAALDSENGAKVMDILSGFAKSPGRCVIIVTHDNRIFKHADRMTFMEDGRIDRTESKQKAA